MTTTRHNKQTATLSRFISIKARIIHTIASSSSSSSGGSNGNDQYNHCHENDGGILSKTKCKSLFSGHFARILIVILVSFTFADMVNAGTCWAKRTQTGKCKHPMERNVSKEKCCGGSDDVGFTEKEMSEFEYFFATALGDGMACSSCLDSCKTANCGARKKCVMRSGEPRCVCAPKCKTKNRRKRGHQHVQSQLLHLSQSQSQAQFQLQSNNRTVDNRSPSSSNSNNHNQHHHHHHHQSIIDDVDDTSHNVQIFHADINNRANMKSDKIVSIIAPIHQHQHQQHHNHSNLSGSHRHKKTTPHTNGAMTQNGRRNMVKPTKTFKYTSTVSSNNNNSHAKQRPNGIKNKHKLAHKNQYSNSTSTSTSSSSSGSANGQLDNNIFNVNHHRRQTSVEQQFKSKFYGHDIPYPPIDLPLYDSNQFHRAVCGNDGKTYISECQLRRRACRQESTSLSVAYKGQCQTSCKHVQCPVGQHCLEDQNLMPHCVTCSITCPPYDPAVKSVISNPARLICGVDGNTYRNLCEIKRTACMLGRSIPVAYRGACKESANCDTVRCKDRQVCLDDLVTHRPRCVSCSFKCPRRKRPQGQQSAFIKICGMNNKSYHSWCHLMRDSCQTGYYIDVKHNGVCHNATNT